MACFGHFRGILSFPQVNGVVVVCVLSGVDKVAFPNPSYSHAVYDVISQGLMIILIVE